MGIGLASTCVDIIWEIRQEVIVKMLKIKAPEHMQ